MKKYMDYQKWLAEMLMIWLDEIEITDVFVQHGATIRQAYEMNIPPSDYAYELYECVNSID